MTLKPGTAVEVLPPGLLHGSRGKVEGLDMDKSLGRAFVRVKLDGRGGYLYPEDLLRVVQEGSGSETSRPATMQALPASAAL